ncbi:hypothetical protein [Zoogloea sp.]|uniref:hypothetical protein n=1 Tax=Zoogloea sp. TaxID=49181 RepID=UPI00141562F3|nr:MAG: hypothetical protein F9K15_20040 [Zoogloea sp.]
MPLQLSWSAVGAYCQHETGKQAGHFGHHSHEHKASEAETSRQADSSASLSIDEDCGLCHYNTLKILAQDGFGLVQSAVPSVLESSPHVFRTHIPPGPDRPNWSAAL